MEEMPRTMIEPGRLIHAPESPSADRVDQESVIEFLETPAAHRGARVERIDTHASIIFLAGTLAHKLKRAVRFDYLDFSTVERRRACCHAEVTLNRRTAPGIYRRAVPVTCEPGGSLTIGGGGPEVDWLVEMNRFDQSALLDRLAGAARLDLALMRPLADAIETLHRGATRRPDHGGAASVRWVIEGNARAFAEFRDNSLDAAVCTAVSEAALHEADRQGQILDARRADGFVRQCHGDLHLRNIVLIDGQPTIFDAIEFNDALACIDVYYDLAFVLMDLLRQGLPVHANHVLNRYVRRTGDCEGLALLPLFLSCRAAVRAKTSSSSARVQVGHRRREELQEAADRYLALAAGYLRHVAPVLLAIGGFSGSGKSTLAQALAPLVGAPPGAVVLRSDEVRKEIHGTASLQPLSAEGYTEEMSARVYRTLADRAAAILRTGHSVVVDAVFARPSDRASVQAAGARAGVPFVGVWLNAGKATLLARVRDRRGDASDAGPAVVEAQLARGSGANDWVPVEGDGSAAEVLRRAAAHVPPAARTPSMV